MCQFAAILNVGGNLEAFPTIEALAEDVEAIDVMNGEYDCFTSDGQEIRLTIIPSVRHPGVIELAKVKGEAVSAPHRISDCKAILREYLFKIGHQPSEGAPIEDLVAFLPRRD